MQISSFEHAGVAEKKDILKQNAYEKVGDMIASKDFQTFLDLRASIEKYSSNNIAMIYLQKPDAKAVMGFHAWKALDRHVEAGQNAIDCEDKVGLKLAEIFNKDNLSEQAITIGKREMFTKSFDRACKLSDQFNKAFDKDFGYSIEWKNFLLMQKQISLLKSQKVIYSLLFRMETHTEHLTA